MRRLQNYVAKYGPEVGPKLYHLLQSQAAYASVGARLRRKLDGLRRPKDEALPLFPEPARDEVAPVSRVAAEG